MNIKNIIQKINKNYFNNLHRLKLFDVSLRDGLQSQKKIYSLDEKKKMLNEIINNYNPDKIEVGSIVSDKVLPQMNNSIELYKYAKNLNNNTKYYLLIPNKKKLKIALDNNVSNMSFISSFSDSFQKKNIKKSLDETKYEIDEINKILINKNLYENKLYLSCFNDCPIEGNIDHYNIINDLLYYSDLQSFNELCLSDTTGRLNNKDFKEIINDIKKIVNVNKLSLHLHVNKDDIDNTLEIINTALKVSISKFDISYINEGGCSVTMDNANLNANLNYKLLEKLIID